MAVKLFKQASADNTILYKRRMAIMKCLTSLINGKGKGGALWKVEKFEGAASLESEDHNYLTFSHRP